MTTIQTYGCMLVAGLFFGIWPLIMNRSGLGGVQSAIIFSTCAAVIIIAFGGMTQGFNFTGAKFSYVFIASCFGGAGLIFLSIGLAHTSPKQVSKLFLIMVIAQIVVPATYHAFVNGGLDVRTGLGITTALVTAFLLT